MVDPEFKWIEGMEAVVNEIDCLNEDHEGGLVGFDCAGEDDWCAPPEHLAPITDSYDKIEWSECIWAPDRVTEAA
jgi:hypothetical protein